MITWLVKTSSKSVIINKMEKPNFIKSYTDLIVWQKGIELVKTIYAITNCFPRSEMFGITSQMRRASISIPSNIAEGFLRNHRPETIQFLFIALGSCGELHTQLIVAKELNYLEKHKALSIIDELTFISKMLRNLIKSLKK